MSEVTVFNNQFGKDLSSVGSAQVGFTPSDAIKFVALLLTKGYSILGVEVWRQANLKWTQMPLEGWYSGDLSTSVEELLLGLSSEQGVLVTVQY